jgi:hypothetical protein
LGAWSQLFFDNLSTLLGAVFALQGLVADGVSPSLMNEYIWGRIVPGVGVAMIAGNIYYSWMAIRLTNKWGRQYTAQPYGLNTPQAFAFVFNIIFSVFYSNIEELGPDGAFIQGYNVALAANFVSGLISIFLGFFGRKILKLVPPSALLVRFVKMKSYMMCMILQLSDVFHFVFLGPHCRYRLCLFGCRTVELQYCGAHCWVQCHHVGLPWMVQWSQDWLGQVSYPRSFHGHNRGKLAWMDHWLEYGSDSQRSC